MSENVKKYNFITSNHVDGYRYGRWALLKGLTTLNGKECYIVQFNDGVIDYWPVVDPWDDYRFKQNK